jgi:hypothetical protein
MATRDEAEAIVAALRAIFPYSFSVEEYFERSGDHYIYIIAEFGTEQDLSPYLTAPWVFSGWENRDQRAWIGSIEKPI